MARDHYISQTYLRQWGHGEDEQFVFTMRKRDQKQFEARTKDLCRIEDGSTNKYLQDPRAIEEFLKEVEPKFRDSVRCLKSVKFGHSEIFVIAGFIAYVMYFSPAGLRINQSPMTKIVAEMGRRLDRLGKIPPFPETGKGSQSC